MMVLFKLFKFVFWWGFSALLGFIYYRTDGLWGFFRRTDDMSNEQYFWMMWLRIGLVVALFMIVKMLFCYLMWGPGPWMCPKMGGWMMQRGM